MISTEQHIKRIHDKLQQLLKQHAAVQKENAQLKNELKASRLKAEEQHKTAEELKQQVSILKMNAVQMTATDKKEFEKRINTYLKEIDRCIAMLGE